MIANALSASPMASKASPFMSKARAVLTNPYFWLLVPSNRRTRLTQPKAAAQACRGKARLPSSSSRSAGRWPS